MSLKDPTQWKGSSWMIRVEKHEQMRQLLSALDLSSPGALILMLTEDLAESVKVLAPIAQKYHAANAKQPKPSEQKKELAAKLKTMNPEQVAKLLASLES